MSEEKKELPEPEPIPFPDEPRPPVGDIAFGTPEEQAAPKPQPPAKPPMVPKEIAEGAPAFEAGAGVMAAQAAISGVETLAQAAQSPQGSIGAFLPAAGGGGQDYAARAVQQSMLAALNSAGRIASRLGG